MIFVDQLKQTIRRYKNALLLSGYVPADILDTGIADSVFYRNTLFLVQVSLSLRRITGNAELDQSI